jgi:uncharacterized protein involved in exopolysaccharide biosynthesis
MLDRNPFANTSANQANEAFPENGDFLRMVDIFQFLRRYFPTIAIATLIGICVAGYIAFTATPVFTARAQVLIDPRISQIQREQVGEAVVPLDTAQMESQLALLRSEGIAKTVIATLDLTKDPDFQFKQRSWLPFRSALRQASEADKLREAILIFQESLDVSRVGISYGIDIAFGAKDPEKAARIANTTAILYVRDQLETRRLAAQAGSSWLEDKINVLRQKMNSAARTAQEFKASRDYRLLPQQDRAREGQSTDRIVDLAQNAREFGITLEELESTAQTYRKLYESYLLAYTEALQRDSYPVSNARVISTALPPLAKSHPKTQLTLALGTLIGLLSGIGIALIRNTV